MKRVTDLDALLKRHSKDKTSKEEYANTLLREIDALMKASRKNRLDFSSNTKTICFERDPITGGINMSVDGEEIDPDDIVERIWSIDHPEDGSKEAIQFLDTAEAKRALGRIAERSIGETLKEARRQAEIDRGTLLQVVKALLLLCKPEMSR